MIITFDLETIPAQNPRVLEMFKLDAEREKQFIKAPGNYKDESKILEYVSTKAHEIDVEILEKWRKTSFDGGFGHICCIGYAIGDSEPVTIAIPGQDHEFNEIRIITMFYDVLRDSFNASQSMNPVFVGHNIIGFDLRFLFQRSVVLGITPPSFIPFDAKPWSDHVFDTMTKWAGASNRVSLNKLCEVFNMPLKGAEFDEEFDGSMVWDAVKSGNIDKVATYCAGDVYRTREIYKRIAFLG
jgi:predicted PolB exonuclease-like 3'-5' exonuclease